MEKIPQYKIHEFLDGDDTCLFEIVEGTHSGLKYRYGVVSFDDSDENDPKMRFSYELDESSKNKVVDEDLVNIMGKILVDVIDGRFSE